MNYEDLERAYNQAMQGSPEPSFVVCPLGIIAQDGHVYGFNEQGVWHRLSPDEEDNRRRDILAWIERIKASGKTPMFEEQL